MFVYQFVRYPAVIDDGIKNFIENLDNSDNNNTIEQSLRSNIILWIEEMVYLATSVSKYKVSYIGNDN